MPANEAAMAALTGFLQATPATAPIEPTDLPETPAQESATESAPVAEPATQSGASQEPTSSSSEESVARLAVVKERLAALRAKNAERRSTKTLSGKEEALKAQEAALKASEEQQRARWAAAAKDPVKGLQELGIKPEYMLQRIHDEIVAADSPEAKERAKEAQIEARIRAEIEKRDPDISAMRKKMEELEARDLAREEQAAQREAQLQAAQKTAREAEFHSILNAPEYNELHNFYDAERLTNMGYFYGKQLHDAGLPYDYKATAKKILDEHTTWWDTTQARMEARAKSKKPTESNSGKPAAQESEVPAAIGNGIVSTSASGETRKLTRDERMKKASKDIASITDKLTVGLR